MFSLGSTPKPEGFTRFLNQHARTSIDHDVAWQDAMWHFETAAQAGAFLGHWVLGWEDTLDYRPHRYMFAAELMKRAERALVIDVLDGATPEWTWCKSCHPDEDRLVFLPILGASPHGEGSSADASAHMRAVIEDSSPDTQYLVHAQYGGRDMRLMFTDAVDALSALAELHSFLGRSGYTVVPGDLTRLRDVMDRLARLPRAGAASVDSASGVQAHTWE